MDENLKICKIISELVKFGVIKDFNVNNEEGYYKCILYNKEDNECIIDNFNKIGIIAVVGENPELLIVYINNEGIINNVFKKYY